MSEFSKAMSGMLGIGANIDLTKVVEIVNAIVAAAPAIEKGIASAEPYISAIVGLVESGGAPSEQDWADLRSRLDVGSQALADAGKEAEDEIAAQRPDPSLASKEEEK